jgi:hypothetical protein
VKENTRVELLAIPHVAAIFGIGALVLFAATERRAVASLRRQSDRSLGSRPTVRHHLKMRSIYQPSTRAGRNDAD